MAAEPTYNAISSQAYIVLGENPVPPDVTDPRTVTLYFYGFDATSLGPVFRFIDDTGAVWCLPATNLTPVTDDGYVPYWAEQLLKKSNIKVAPVANSIYLQDNVYIGSTTGGSRLLNFFSGTLLGATQLQQSNANDGITYNITLPAGDPATENQVVGVSAISGHTTNQAYQTVDSCLARGIAVDLNITTKQVLYTVPAGRVCYITKVLVRDPSGSVTIAKAPFGFNANADDVLPTQDLSALTGGTIYEQFVVTSGTEGAATNTFGTKLTTAQGSAMTCKADVFGYLV